MSRKPPISEHAIQGQIMDWLKLKRIWFMRCNTGGFKDKRNHYVKFGEPGAPDIISILKGRFWGIECKSANGVQSQKQYEFQVELEKAGGIYTLARELEDVLKDYEAVNVLKEFQE